MTEDQPSLTFAMADDDFVAETSSLRCRFYENVYPEPEEVVMVNVTEIGEMGAYVTLIEYDDIEVSHLNLHFHVQIIISLFAISTIGYDSSIRVDKASYSIDKQTRTCESDRDCDGNKSG